VIKQAHVFLDTVHPGRQPLATDREKEIALGNVVAAIRQDLFRPGLGVATLEAAGRRLSPREAELKMCCKVRGSGPTSRHVCAQPHQGGHVGAISAAAGSRSSGCGVEVPLASCRDGFAGVLPDPWR
jgi:hypothetical protein